MGSTVDLNAQKLREIMCYELNGIFQNFRDNLSQLFTANGIVQDFSQRITLTDHSDDSRIELHILSGKLDGLDVFLYRLY